MIKGFICCLIVLCGFGSFAQEKKTPYISKQDHLLIGLTLDNWSGVPAGMETNATRSRGFTFLTMKDVMNEKKNMGFAYGIGFSSQNVHSNSFFSDSSGKTIISAIPDSLKKVTNKLSLNFIDAALEIRIHSQPNSHGNQWKLSVGMKGGILIQDHVKYEDKNGKVKHYDTPNLNNYQYGVTARIGYSIIALSGYYSLSPVFKKSAAAEMNPYSIGITLTF